AKSYVPEILFNKTYAYRMTDNTEKEFECLKQMADNKYRKEEIYVSLLTHLFIKKDNKAFKKYLEIAESLNFESPGIMYIKGWCFLKKNNYLAAYIEFSKMDQRGFSLDIFGTRYYEAAKAIGKNDQALEILNRIINDFPDHEEARSLRAEEYLERGQNPDSSGDLQFLYEADNMYYDKNVKLIGAQRKKIKRVLKHRKFNFEKKD
ncbi:MAG: hypothetical protein RBS16_08730, partial [Candidatus Cloacimonadales bacterium]|nr:hypothetical protein [Candidatus Cloacimonadales bacterium]